MAKPLFQMPDHFIHEIEYRVVYNDINAANHMGADRVLPVALEAQFSLVRALGFDNAVVFENAGLIMVNSQIDYLREVTYGTRLRVQTAADLVTTKSLVLHYRIASTEGDLAVANVRTTLLFFDYATKTVISAPERFRSRLAQLQHESRS